MPYFGGQHSFKRPTGNFVANTATIRSGATVILGSDHRMSNVIVYGSLITSAILLDVSGNFTNNPRVFTHGNGTLRFSGNTLQNPVLNVPTTFHNLAVASGTTLVETVADDNAGWPAR